MPVGAGFEAMAMERAWHSAYGHVVVGNVQRAAPCRCAELVNLDRASAW